MPPLNPTAQPLSIFSPQGTGLEGGLQTMLSRTKALTPAVRQQILGLKEAQRAARERRSPNIFSLFNIGEGGFGEGQPGGASRGRGEGAPSGMSDVGHGGAGW